MAFSDLSNDDILKLVKLKKESWDAQAELAALMGTTDTREDKRIRNVAAGDPAAIEAGIADVVKMARHSARMVLAGSRWNDLTEEGRKNFWEEKTAIHRTRLDRLEEAMAGLHDAAQAHLERAWQALHPVVKGQQETQTAEMYVSRVLGRGKPDHLDLDKIAKAEPSPGRTLLLEEWVARGWFDQDQVDKFIAGGNEEYMRISREVNHIKGDVNSVLRTQLRFARERLESPHAANRPEQRYEGMLKVRTQSAADEGLTSIPDATSVRVDWVGEVAPELEDWEVPNRSYTEGF